MILPDYLAARILPCGHPAPVVQWIETNFTGVHLELVLCLSNFSGCLLWQMWLSKTSLWAITSEVTRATTSEGHRPLDIPLHDARHGEIPPKQTFHLSR